MAPNNQSKPCYKFGRFRLYPSERRLLCDGKFIKLEPKLFDLLLVLVAESDHLFKKDELMERVWPGIFVGEGTLFHNISALKKMLSEAASEYEYIETVPKSGYRFKVSVKLVDADEAPPAGDSLSGDQSSDKLSPAQTTNGVSSSVHNAVEDGTQNVNSDAQEASPAEAQDASCLPLASDQSHDGELPAQAKDGGSSPALPIVEKVTEEKTDESGYSQSARHHPQPAPSVVENALPTEERAGPDEGTGKDGDAEPSIELEAVSNLPLPLDRSSAEKLPLPPTGEAATSVPQPADTATQNAASDGPASVQIDDSPADPTPPPEKAASTTDAWAMAIIASLVICAVLAQYINDSVPGIWIERYAFLLQFLVIIWAWMLTKVLGGPRRFSANKQQLEEKVREASGYARKADWKDAKRIAEHALENYKTYWYGLLVSWGLLYIVLAFLRRYPPNPQAFIPDPQAFIQAIVSKLQDANPGVESQAFAPAIAAAVQRAISPAPIPANVATLKIFATLFNNCNSLMLALGYMLLNQTTVVKAASTASEKMKQYINKVSWGRGIVLIVGITAIETVWVILSPNEAYKANVIEGFEWISGIGGGVTLALYVGRLQSKFLNLPHSIFQHEAKRLGAGRLQSIFRYLLRRFQHKFPNFLPGLLIIALYCYAAIQPLYSLIGKYPKVVAVVIVYVALILKGLLCYCIIRFLQSGRLLFYFVRVRRTSYNVEPEWQDFSQLLE